MIVLGVDPGSRRAGYGIVKSESNAIVRIESGFIALEGLGDVTVRLAQLHKSLSDVITRHTPEQAAVEKVFFGYNVKSAIALGQSRGVVLAVLGAYNIPLFEYNPTEVKASVTRRGRASKDQVRKFVSFILGGYNASDDNEADALAIALCHVNKSARIILKSFRD